MTSILSATQNRQIERTFMFTQDNSGALSRDEFAYILRKLGEPLTDFEVDEILDHFDRDGSGEIDFDGKKSTG